MTTTPAGDRPLVPELEGLLAKAADAWEAFVTARERMNAAIPSLDATQAERAVYDERYKADHAAEREHWQTAIGLAQHATQLLALLKAAQADGERVARLTEALRPFAKAGELFDHEPADPRWVVSIYKPAAGDDYAITDRHLREARAALSEGSQS